MHPAKVKSTTIRSLGMYIMVSSKEGCFIFQYHQYWSIQENILHNKQTNLLPSLTYVTMPTLQWHTRQHSDNLYTATCKQQLVYHIKSSNGDHACGQARQHNTTQPSTIQDTTKHNSSQQKHDTMRHVTQYNTARHQTTQHNLIQDNTTQHKERTT